MAEPGQAANESISTNGGMTTWVLLGMVGLMAAAGGFMVPLLLGSRTGSGHDIRPGSPRHASQNTDSEPHFIPFGEVVVNLREERLTRYIRVNFTLQVTGSQDEKKAVAEAVEKHKLALRSWLIGYLSDKALNEVKGAAGVNRMRREIQDQFNTILFPDGIDRIENVLFQEFVVQ